MGQIGFPIVFHPQCLATAIGSLPHTDPAAACDVILNSIPEIPFWPQLPHADFREGMEIQYCEGLPGLIGAGARGIQVCGSLWPVPPNHFADEGKNQNAGKG